MVGETIAKRSVWFALAFAIGFHVLLFAIHISFDAPISKRATEISITFLDEKMEEERAEEKPVEEIEKQLNKLVKPPSFVRPVTSILVAKPAKVESKQSSARLVVNTNSDEFKKFLRNETDSFRNADSKSLGEFDQTFEAQSSETNEVSAISKEAKTQIRRMGVGMSEDKYGNRTCYAQIPNLNDANGPPQLLNRPCTPTKKFILDLDKPRNN